MIYYKQSCSQVLSTFPEAGKLQRIFSEKRKPSHLKNILYPKTQACGFTIDFPNSFLHVSLKSLVQPKTWFPLPIPAANSCAQNLLY